MKDLGLEVETLEKSLYVNSPLRVRVDQICQDCELEISRILLTADLRVMNMSEFNVILGTDWLTAHRVVIDCDHKRVTAYTLDGHRVTFQRDKHDALSRAMYEFRWHGQLMGWVVSLTSEDEVRQDLDLPCVICEYEDVFLDELSRLPPYKDVDFVIELHLGTPPISMTLHRMALAELHELKVQLQ